MARHKKGKDKYYRASIVIGRTADGAQKRKTVKSRSKREFEEKLGALKEQYGRGFDFDSAGTTVDQWVERWLETYKKPTVSDKAYKDARALFKNHVLPHIGHCSLADVRAYQVQEVMNRLSGKSRSMAQKVRDAMRQTFAQAKWGGLILDSPAEFVKMPKTVTTPRRALTLDERGAVVKLCETHRAGLWVMFMLMCGLRVGETVPLTWGDVDFGRGMLTVDKAVAFEGNRAKPKLTKTEAGARQVPIPLPLMARLAEERKKRQLPERSAAYIFTPAQSDGMLTGTNVRRLWCSFYRELDIACGAELYRNAVVKTALKPGIMPHALRHTYCTDLYEMGVDLKTAQYLMGHADIKTTANIYTHVRSKMLDEAQKKVEEFYERGTRGEPEREKQPKMLKIV